MKNPATEPEWDITLKPIYDDYGKRKHPLDYKNRYELVVAVVLSGGDSDKHINSLTPAFFKAFTSMKELSKADPEDIYPYIKDVNHFINKANWITSIAKIVHDDDHIPWTLDELIKLPGIGRKSANVIIRESGGEAEGVIVDLHVARVAPRPGIAKGTSPEKIEKLIMGKLPKKHWGEAGMAISFLGREICRPTNPHCEECKVNSACEYFYLSRRKN